LDLSGALLVGDDPELYALKEAGKRMAGILNAQVCFGKGLQFGRVMAFALADGSGDGTVYDTYHDAMAHQAHERECHYEILRPASYSADECALTLAYARAFYDAGGRPDPQYPMPIAPVRLEDRTAKLRQMRRHARRKHR
jgi:hypothetical protein